MQREAQGTCCSAWAPLLQRSCADSLCGQKSHCYGRKAQSDSCGGPSTSLPPHSGGIWAQERSADQSPSCGSERKPQLCSWAASLSVSAVLTTLCPWLPPARLLPAHCQAYGEDIWAWDHSCPRSLNYYELSIKCLIDIIVEG